jgi:hypothetical protein
MRSHQSNLLQILRVAKDNDCYAAACDIRGRLQISSFGFLQVLRLSSMGKLTLRGEPRQMGNHLSAQIALPWQNFTSIKMKRAWPAGPAAEQAGNNPAKAEQQSTQLHLLPVQHKTTWFGGAITKLHPLKCSSI